MSEGISHGTVMKAVATGVVVGVAALFRHIYTLRKTNDRLADQLAALAYHTSRELEGAAAAAAITIEHDKPINARAYEQERLVQEYLLMHYGEELGNTFVVADDAKNSFTLNVTTPNAQAFGNFGVFDLESDSIQPPQYPRYALNFPARVAQLAIHFAKKQLSTADQAKAFRALDVGCSVGRTTFELTKYFKQVVGLDYSFSFIQTANALKSGQKLDYSFTVEGNVVSTASAALHNGYDLEHVEFVQGDATNLSVETLGKFNCVVAANLIDRLPAPRRFLESCSELIERGGILVLTSPYTWLKEYTPVSQWLQSPSGSTFEALKEVLSANFELLHDSHMPFLIRETGRKHQFTFAHATIWKRK